MAQRKEFAIVYYGITLHMNALTHLTVLVITLTVNILFILLLTTGSNVIHEWPCQSICSCVHWDMEVRVIS